MTIHDAAIHVLTELRDTLPTGHQELPGVIRAIEVLRTDILTPAVTKRQHACQKRNMPLCAPCHDGHCVMCKGQETIQHPLCDL